MKTKKAMELMQVSRTTLNNLVKSGAIKVQKRGLANDYRDEDVLKYIESKTEITDHSILKDLENTVEYEKGHGKEEVILNIKCINRQFNDCEIGKVAKGEVVKCTQSHYNQIVKDFGNAQFEIVEG